MSRLRFQISISLDGFIAGPDQSVDDPLGKGGMQLHEWVVPARRLARPARARGRRGERVDAR